MDLCATRLKKSIINCKPFTMIPKSMHPPKKVGKDMMRIAIARTSFDIRHKHDIRFKDITINRELPFISVGEQGSCFYFAQGDDADAMLKDVDAAVENFGCAEKSVLLWLLESAGVFNPPNPR